jgi:hypothetical protein
MRTQDEVVRPFALMPIPCPDCGGQMRLAAVMPADSPEKGDVITYRCDACNCDLKRVTRKKNYLADRRHIDASPPRCGKF